VQVVVQEQVGVQVQVRRHMQAAMYSRTTVTSPAMNRTYYMASACQT